jgi:hypothetical protein
MEPIVFDLPVEENPEPGKPDHIEHGCDYMLSPDGKLEYYYNFLVYTWEMGSEEISARSYLDNPHEISIVVSAQRLREDIGLRDLVRFLQRRYTEIRCFHREDLPDQEAGYSLVYHRRH